MLDSLPTSDSEIADQTKAIASFWPHQKPYQTKKRLSAKA
jgi:hypothetical protein